MATLRFSVAEEDAGSRLDRALAARAEIGTRSLAERLVRSGAVTVDGAVRPKSHRLEAGSVVEVELPPAGGVRSRRSPSRSRVPTRTSTSLVVDKPAGMTVHPGRGARRRGRSPGSSSRSAPRAATIPTGRGSSTGSIATRPGSSSSRAPRQAHAALQEAIRRREVERRYLALVRGRPRSRTGRIDAPIGRDRRDPTRRSLDTDEPRDAVTWFEVARDAARARAPRRARSRRGGRTRSACISPRSSSRCRATRVRRERRPRPRAAVPARAPPALRASGHAVRRSRSRVARCRPTCAAR